MILLILQFVLPLVGWKKYDYVEARKNIYIPIYSRGCIETKAFEKLLNIYRTTEKDIYLVDFDGYNHKKLNRNGRKMTQKEIKK